MSFRLTPGDLYRYEEKSVFNLAGFSNGDIVMFVKRVETLQHMLLLLNLSKDSQKNLMHQLDFKSYFLKLKEETK